MRVRTLVAAALMLGLTANVGEGSQQPRVTGFYSDFAYHPQSGDVVGVEVFISYALIRNGLQSQYYAYVQVAEGVTGEPQLVPATVDGTQISFSLSGEFARISPFTGAVTSDSLIGQFAKGWEVRLPRRASYWE